jgi:Zn finger protein HypA/HybF involved in hydrogenase expression
MGVSKRKRRRMAVRVCLKCERGFLSEGIYNRICRNCHESNRGIHGGNEHQVYHPLRKREEQ